MEWLVSVTVLQVAGLTLGEGEADAPSPYVTVQIGSEIHQTNHVEDASSCSFGHTFCTCLHLEEDEFLSGDIEIIAYHYRGFGLSTELGHGIFSLRKVYYSDKHSVPKSWYQILQRGHPETTVGFAQLIISAYGTKDPVPRSFASFDTSGEGASIKSRTVTLPTAAKVKNLYQLLVRVHKAESLRSVAGLIANGVDPYVQVDFHGTSQTTAVKSGHNVHWNQEVRVPFQMPCWDDSINVFLKSSKTGGLGEELLGEITFHIDDLIKQELPPTWYNFYYAPKEAGPGLSGLFRGNVTTEDSAFAGRLLVSVAMERCETPALQVVDLQSKAREPNTIKGILWVDVYQVCIDSAQQPTEVYVSATLGPDFEEELHCPGKGPTGHAFNFTGGEDGRLPEKSLTLVDKDQCADIIVNVHGFFRGALGFGGGWTRYAFVRVPAAEVWNWENTPRWYELFYVQGSAGPKNAGFILMTLNIGREKERPKNRPARQPFNPRNYMFKAHIYQAADLPWLSKGGERKVDGEGTDPCAVVFFGPAVLQTDRMPWTNNPTWNVTLEQEVQLPRRPELRPDIIIYLLNRSVDGTVTPLAMCRYKIDDPEKFPEEWKCKPMWLPLQQVPGEIPVRHPKILVSFEVAKHDGNGASEPPPDPEQPQRRGKRIEVETTECRVQFYAMGLRMFDSSFITKTPSLVVGIGRNHDEPEDSQVFKRIESKTQCTGRELDFDFKEKITLACDLSKSEKMQEWLEIRLLVEGEDEYMEVLPCGAMIQLTPCLPWLTAKQQKKAEHDFHTHLLHEEESEHEEEEAEGGGAAGHWKDARSLLKQGEKRLCKAIGWDVPSIEASNIRKLDFMEFVNTNFEDDERLKEELEHQKAELRKSLMFDPRGSVASLATGDVDQMMSALNSLIQPTKDKKGKNKKAKKEKEAAKGKKGDEEGDQPDGPKVLSKDDIFAQTLATFAEGFTWPKPPGAGDGLETHPDLDVALEDGPLSHHPLPYKLAPVVIATERGEPQQVGVLKYCLRVYEASKQGDSKVKDEAKAFQDNIDRIEATMKKCKGLSVRAYILSADGLIPHSGSTDVSTFVESRLDDGDNFNHDDTCVRQTRHPQYHTTHTYNNVVFPGHCTMEFSVFEVGNLEQPIGRTYIDLEDRWFRDRYQEMVRSDVVPIESRKLLNHDSGFSKGHLRLWVDIMSQEMARERKPIVLPSTNSVPFQLRIVIWKVIGVDACVEDGTHPSIYVQASHQLDNKTVITKRTDTHEKTNDGVGTFNWRMLFDIFIPCRDPKITLRVVDDGYFDDDCLGEVSFDFGRDFQAARKGNCAVELERGIVRLTHPAFPGQIRCEVDLEAKLLPSVEAVAHAVGEGQEEPNEDPFCDPDDPHRKAHRDLGLGVIAAIAGAAGGLLKMGAYMTILYAAGSVFGGIMLTITSIVMMTK